MEEPILLGLLLVDADGLLDPVHFFLELVDAAQGDEVGAADGDDADADEDGKRGGRDIGVLEPQDTHNGAANTQQQDAPPIGEADPLVVKALNGRGRALDDDPQGKDDRERNGDKNLISQQNATQDNLQDGREGTAAAVGQEAFRAESENQFGDTGKEGEDSDKPRQRKEGFGRTANAGNAENDEQDTCHCHPDFSTFHRTSIFDIGTKIRNFFHFIIKELHGIKK